MNCEIEFSIIIAYHLNRKGLLTLIRSIPPRKDIEVIVINDHSDPVDDIIYSIEFKNLKLKYILNNSEKRYAGSSRNIGIAHASGRYLTFADDDDLFTESFSSILDDYVDKDSDFDIIFFPPKSLSSDGKLSDRHIRYENLCKEFNLRNSERIRYNYFPPWSKLVSRSFILKNNIFFDEVKASNDVKFSVKSGHYAQRVSVDMRSFYIITDRPNSLTKDKSIENLKTRYEVVKQVNLFLISEGKKAHLIPIFELALKINKNSLISLTKELLERRSEGHLIFGFRRYLYNIKSRIMDKFF